LNQARLFAIETRLKEGEDTRVNDTHFLKETVKKLVFALEQSVVNGEKQEIALNEQLQKQYRARTSTSGYFRGGKNLPNLMQKSPLRDSVQVSGFTSLSKGQEEQSEELAPKTPTIDMLFLKRLHFLKTQIE